MQAITILLIGISCRRHFVSSYNGSVAGVKVLVTWLQHMRQNNETAQRVYQVIYNIVKSPNLSNPAIWEDIVCMFPDEIMQQGQSQLRRDVDAYPWTNLEQNFQHSF
jgi:hypothetical protein